MGTYLLRLWLPDRPGALGAVASRIGSVGADVVGIEVLEQGADRAIDELVLRIPHAERIELLLSELAEVDGVSVEDLREVPAARADRGVDLLELAASMIAREHDDVVQTLLEALQPRFDLDWIAVVGPEATSAPHAVGDAPADEWLAAYGAGVRSGGPSLAGDDVVHAPLLADGEVLLLAGRSRYALHERERTELALLARICGAALADVLSARR